MRDNVVQFDIKKYNRSEDIIIDPYRIWATYYGGSSTDYGWSICTDNSGNIYVTGRTESTNFPIQTISGAYNQTTSGGSWDAFILKFNSSGARLWAIYYGGSGKDVGWNICTDNSGALYVTGRTGSSNFPIQTLTGAYNQTTYGGGSFDAYILKFSSNGGRIWATYYGGSNTDYGQSICTDNSGNVFVTGWTKSTNFPTQTLTGAYNQTTYGGGDWDAFILKFNSSGARIWATYYGGSSTDYGYEICIDNSGNVFVTGGTASTNFPTQTLTGAYNQTTYGGGNRDAFILKFNSSGARLWATYYGGSGGDVGCSICTDNSGYIYITGETRSTNFPIQILTGAYNQTTSGGSSWDAFILKFSSSGARIWATYYGGGSLEDGRSICTDNSGALYVTGWTRSTNFPTQTLSGAYNQTTSGGLWDAYILKFNSSGARLWATYYGGSDDDIGYFLCTDNSGTLYVTGHTKSTNFPTKTLAGAYNQTTFGGVRDAFILKFSSSGARLWATYYGGSNDDYGYGICTDNSDALYATGRTESTNFPTKTLAGAYNQTYGGNGDAFILKFNSNGARLWATYYGGSGSDYGLRICTDNSGALYVTGITGSTNFPTQTLTGAYNQITLGGGNDAFILKFGVPPIQIGELTDFPVVSSSMISSYKTIGNKIYFFGGYILGTNPYQCYDKIRTYNLQSNIWSQLSFTLPYGIYDGHISASYYNNHFYVPPGFATGNSGGWGSHNKMIDVNLGTNTATETHSFPMSRIWDIGNCEVNGKIYFFGGWTGSARSEIFEYNPQTDSLKQVANMNFVNNKVSVVVANNGWIYYQGRSSSKFERFNPTTHVVETMTATIPFSEGYIHCWYIPNENSIYFFNSGLNKDIYKYDYVNDVIVNTGITLNGNFVAIPAVKDSNDPYSIYAFKLNPDYNHPLRLCKLTIGLSGISISGNITPKTFTLHQNYPNPFNPSTNIKFDIPKSSNVKLSIYNILGREITTLVNEKLSAGSYQVDWNASGFTSGVYFYRLVSDEFVETRKMLLIK